MRFMKLRHIADIRNSNVDKVVVKEELPIRLCNYVDVYKNDFIEATMDFSAGSATRAEIKAFGLREGDVIITKDSEDRNDIGVPALVRSAAPDLVCGYHLALLRAKEGVAIGPFLFWALLSKPARDAFSNAAYGITRFGMTLGSMKNVAIPLPDLATQRRIADFLDRETARIDRAIEKKQRLVELIDEKRASLITAVVTGQLAPNADQHGLSRDLARKSGMEGREASLQEQRLSLSPTGWERKRIKHHLAGFLGGGTPAKDNEAFWTNGSIPWVSPKDMKSREISDAEDKITVEAVQQSATNVVPPNSVLMVVRSGILKHSLPVAINSIPVALNQDLKAFRFRPSLNEQFFVYWVEGQEKNLLLEWGQIGATVDNIDIDTMLNSIIPLPGLATQRQIADFLDHETAKLDSLKTKTDESIARLKEYRAALITAAVTGQIDVEAHARAGATERQLDTTEQEADA